MFIYFGFTYCPDICPNELMRMAEVITSLGPSFAHISSRLYSCSRFASAVPPPIADRDKETAGLVEPIFITIDPERDGPIQARPYRSRMTSNAATLHSHSPRCFRDLRRAHAQR
jgi:cytochrome oxidase Cu insertion factor (SCO1/SenC/PrrC family)